MRMANVSAFFVMSALILWVRPTKAQNNPVGSLRSSESLSKLSPSSRASGPLPAERRDFASHADGKREALDMLRSFGNLVMPKERLGSMGMQIPHVVVEGNRCAHMVIIPEPGVDSKMMERIPKEFRSNMPRLEGLPMCCRDLREELLPRWNPSAGPRP